MSTFVKRPISFIVTLVLKDGRQFILSDVECFYSWVHTPSVLIQEALELYFYDGTVVDVFFSNIDRFNISVLFDVDVVPFDLFDCDYGVHEFADHISSDPFSHDRRVI